MIASVESEGLDVETAGPGEDFAVDFDALTLGNVLNGVFIPGNPHSLDTEDMKNMPSAKAECMRIYRAGPGPDLYTKVLDEFETIGVPGIAKRVEEKLSLSAFHPPPRATQKNPFDHAATGPAIRTHGTTPCPRTGITVLGNSWRTQGPRSTGKDARPHNQGR